ncbi:hypothetical protein [Brevibacillus laterosporus]
MVKAPLFSLPEKGQTVYLFEKNGVISPRIRGDLVQKYAFGHSVMCLWQ